MNIGQNGLEGSRRPWREGDTITDDPGLKQLLQTLWTMVQGPALIDSYDVFLDLRIVTSFDLVFGGKAGRVFLVDMINAFLPSNVDSINSLTKIQQPKGSSSGKQGHKFDFCFEDDLGRLIVIDMQKTFLNNYQKQIEKELNNVTNAWLQQTSAKNQRNDFPVIGLSIVDFLVGGQPTGNCIKVADDNDDQLQVLDMTKGEPLLLLTELKKIETEAEDLYDTKEMFLFLLANLGRIGEVPNIFNTEYYLPLFDLARFADRNKEEKARYEQAVYDQVVLEDRAQKFPIELFKYGLKDSFTRDVEETGNKRKIQEFTCGRLYVYSHLTIEEIADIVELSEDEVKAIIKEEGMKLISKN